MACALRERLTPFLQDGGELAGIGPRVSPGATVSFSLWEKWGRREWGFVHGLELWRDWLLRGLKPGFLFDSLIGPAEAVPLLQSLVDLAADWVLRGT